MTVKFILIAAVIACVRAGGPASYSISALSGDHAYVGSSHENTVKGLYGQNVLSQYTKAVDSAHSSVRVSNSRQSNDGYAPHYAGYAAPAIAHGYAPAIHSGYARSPYAAPVAYGAHYGAVPAIASYAHAAPISAYGRPGPAILPSYGYGHAAPYAAHGYAAPLAYKTPIAAYGAHGAPAAVVHSSFLGHGASYAW